MYKKQRIIILILIIPLLIVIGIVSWNNYWSNYRRLKRIERADSVEFWFDDSYNLKDEDFIISTFSKHLDVFQEYAKFIKQKQEFINNDVKYWVNYEDEKQQYYSKLFIKRVERNDDYSDIVTYITYDLEPKEKKFIDYLNDEGIKLNSYYGFRIKASMEEDYLGTPIIDIFITIEDDITYHLVYQENEPQPILDDDSVDPQKNFYVLKKVVPLGENWYLLISKQNKNIITVCSPKLD